MPYIDTVPKTEKDFEIYFKLQELLQTKQMIDTYPSPCNGQERMTMEQFENDKKEFLKFVNELTKEKHTYIFNIKEIEADGWRRTTKYFPRGNKNEWHYDKALPDLGTRSISVVFGEDGRINEIFTYSGCAQRNIKDMKDLNYFFENNK